MHRRTSILLALLLVAPFLGGCDKVRARVELKKGNAFYQQESYNKALTQFQEGLELDPGATFAWRSVGLTALALYRPGDLTPQNVEYGRVAIDAFEKYLVDYPDDTKVQEYLMTTYVNAKKYDDALTYIDRRIQSYPEEKQLLERYKVTILTQAGRLGQAAQMAQNAPREQRPEMLYTIGVTAWDKSYNDPSLSPEAREQVVETGLTALKQALDIKPEYFEAMAYYNLLFREKAKLTSDPLKREEYLNNANEWAKKATELRKRQTAQAAKPAA
ncbi:MAG TPA: hypothetical protein VF756_21870 [Thermoanaerobaculia bacterium]